MVKRVLIIQLTRLGDSVQTLPVLKLLKRQFPESSVTVLCVKEFSGIYSRAPFYDRLVALPAVDVAPMRNRTAFQKFDDYPELTEEYDSVINLTHNWVGGYFCGNAKGISKSGLMNCDLPNGRVKSAWAKYLFASQKCRIENLFNLVDVHSALAGLTPEPVRNYMRVDDDEIRDSHALLVQNGFKKKGRLIALQLGANMLHRAWPPERFSSLAKRLLQRPEIEVVLLGTGGEKGRAQAVQSGLDLPVIDLVGKTRISELPGILKQCSMLVSNDTGTIHLAAAAGAATVGLFFSTAYFAETAPYGAGHAALQAELPCSPCHVDQMCDDPTCRGVITVEAVEAVVEKVLGYRNSLNGVTSPGLSVYISDFTRNGPLLYAPAEPEVVSDRFLKGLVYRALWGKALGLVQNEPVLNLFDPYRSDSVLEKIDEASEKNGRFLNWYFQAARLLEQAAMCADLPSGAEQLVSIDGILKTIEAAILSSEDSILKYYHMLQMADIDCHSHQETVRAMGGAYGRLLSLVTSFGETIELLRSALNR